MIRLPETGSVLGRCGCQAEVRADSFRDECSEVEWYLSGFCQACQDRFFLAVDQEGDARVHPIRFGSLSAHRSSGRQVLDISLLPFLFIPSLHLLAWEARFGLRLGPVLPRALASELDPMTPLLAGHRVRVTQVYSFADSRLSDWFSDLDLLVALDRGSIEAIVAACPVLGSGLTLALADEFPWSEMIGRPLSSFAHFVGAAGLDPVRTGEWPSPSSLRLCARMGAALARRGPDPSKEECTGLWHLLESVKHRFPDPPKGA